MSICNHENIIRIIGHLPLNSSFGEHAFVTAQEEHGSLFEFLHKPRPKYESMSIITTHSFKLDIIIQETASAIQPSRVGSADCKRIESFAGAWDCASSIQESDCVSEWFEVFRMISIHRGLIYALLFRNTNEVHAWVISTLQH